MKDEIIEKIQKLLSLANSDNENEAKIATTRANELLIKYNLSLQTVTDRQFEYIDQKITSTGLTFKPHQKMISQILISYFFVRIVIGRVHIGYSSGRWAKTGEGKAQYKKVISLVGTKENCQIATYIFSYLNDAFPKLWEQYKTKNKAKMSHRISYYTGLTQGLKLMLDQTKWKVENETGLIVKKDPKLDEYLKKISGGSYGNASNTELNHRVVQDGFQDGKNIQLRKPLDSQVATESGKSLTGKIK